jgi:hypothetical protein
MKGVLQSIQGMVLSVYIRAPEKVSDSESENRRGIAGAVPEGAATAGLG